MDNKIKHYIRTNGKKHITYGFSTAFEQPLESDICINEESRRHFELLGEVNPPLIDENSLSLYKYTDKVEKRTQEEMQADLVIINATPKPKTELELIKETVDLLLIESLGGI